MADVQLKLRLIDVVRSDGATSAAVAEGNNASWDCLCGSRLLGRSYFQFGHLCHTDCPACGRRYRVVGDMKKRAILVVEDAA